MKHRGEILKRAIDNSPISISRIAKELRKTSKTIYNWFETQDVPLDHVLLVGKVIGHDFTKELPELKKYNASGLELNIDYK